MCPREDIDYQGLQLKAELESELTAVKTELVEVRRSLEEKLDAVLTKLGKKGHKVKKKNELMNQLTGK